MRSRIRGAAAAHLLEQHLRDHGDQRLAQHGPHLRLLRRREDVDDAVDGLRRARGVQGAEDEVAGLRGGQGERGGLEVAQLADEDDVRVLAQGAPERGREGVRVRADLPLVDEGALRAVDELDRILEREHVPRHHLSGAARPAGPATPARGRPGPPGRGSWPRDRRSPRSW
jgi:hypothetical protein